MYGKNPYPLSGTQPAPTAGYPGAAQPMTGKMMPTQEMMMGAPMMGAPMMGVAPVEETYVENILRMNRGKIATIYTTHENNPQWAAQVFTGRVENAARDHVVVSDPETGRRYIVLMVTIDYITFDEPLRYEPGIYRM